MGASGYIKIFIHLVTIEILSLFTTHAMRIQLKLNGSMVDTL